MRIKKNICLVKKILNAGCKIRNNNYNNNDNNTHNNESNILKNDCKREQL